MIVSTNVGGLGNRLKSWVSAMRLSPDAKVYWEVNKTMPADFSQLFVNDCGIRTVPPDAEVYHNWRLVILPEDKAYLPAGFATAGAGAHPVIRAIGKAWWNLRGRPDDRYRYMIFPKTFKRNGTNADARYIDFEYGRIPAYFFGVFIPLFQQITVRPEIIRRVDEWGGRNLGRDVIGVQVRSWRDDRHRHMKYHKPSMKRLYRLMDKADPDARFLVVSDSDEIISMLAERYGDGRVIHFPRATCRKDSWKSPEGIIEDLIDMLLLSKTPRIFTSFLSTFSETAWWLGGATASVRVF